MTSRRWFSFVLVIHSKFDLVNHFMHLAAGIFAYVACCVGYLLVHHTHLLQCGSGGVAGLCGFSRGSGRRPQVYGIPTTSIAGDLRHRSPVAIRSSTHNSASQPGGVGIQSSKAQFVPTVRRGTHTMVRPKPMGNYAIDEPDYITYSGRFTSSGEEDEIRERFGPSRRKRIPGDRRQSTCKADGELCQPHRWTTSCGRRTHKRTTFSFASKSLCVKSTSLRRFRSVHTTQQEVHEGHEVQDLSTHHGGRLHGEGSARSSDALTMVGELQSVENRNAHARNFGLGPHPKIRVVGREHGETTARLLASHRVGGGQGSVRPTRTSSNASHFESECRGPSTKRMGRQSPMLGPYLQTIDRRPPVLARTRALSSNVMAGIWEAWPTENACRDHGSSDNGWRREFTESRSGISAGREVYIRSVEPNEETTSEQGQERGSKEEIEKRQRRIAKIQRRRIREVKRKRKRKDRERRTAVLQLEQWQWLLRWIGTWSGMQRCSQAHPQVHEVHVTGSPISTMPLQGKVRMCGGGEASGSRDGGHRVPGGIGGHREGEDHGREGSEDEPDGRERDNKRKREEDSGDFSLTEEEYLAGRKFRFIHHFSGKKDVLGEAMASAAQVHGIQLEVISVDKEAGSGNLMESEPYDSHLEWARQGKVDGYHAGWPCTTYSRLRWRSCVGMPGPVRSRKFPYGFPSNSSKEQEECDTGTVMLARSLMMAEAIESRKNGTTLGGFATLENPPPSSLPDHQSAWEMQETRAFLRRWRSFEVDFNTCCYEIDVEVGKRHFKPQRFAGSMYELGSLSSKCSCGNAGHEPIIGAQRSKASAEYPEALCAKYSELAMKHFKKLAKVEYYRKRVAFAEKKLGKVKKLAEEKGAERVQSRAPWSPIQAPKETTATSWVSTTSGWHGHHEIHDWRGGMGKHESLRNSQAKQADPKQQCYLGGMRHPARVIRTMGNAQSLGVKVRAAWEFFVDKYPEAVEVAEKYGTEDCQLDQELVMGWNTVLKEIVNAAENEPVTLTENKVYKSALDANLLEGWIRASADPDTVIPTWVREGVPLGIERRIPCTGIFPPSDEAGPALASEDAVSAIIRGDLLNYLSVEDNKGAAIEELKRYQENKYLYTLSAEEAEKTFPRRTVSKLGLILKQREDGSTKKRIIVDMRRSQGNLKAHLPERLVLPRPMDVIAMTRDVYDKEGPRRTSSQEMWGSEYVLIDVTDAFMSFGIHKDERGHCISPFPKMTSSDPDLVCFTALLFGGKTAPLLYSRLASLTSRILQAITKPEVGIHQTYLDDSLWFFQGPLVQRNKAISLVIHTMAALGLKVSFSKGHRSSYIQWIGITFKLVNNEKITQVYGGQNVLGCRGPSEIQMDGGSAVCGTQRRRPSRT